MARLQRIRLGRHGEGRRIGFSGCTAGMPAAWPVLRTMVASSVRSVWKPWTGVPSAWCRRAILAFAVAERYEHAHGDQALRAIRRAATHAGGTADDNASEALPIVSVTVSPTQWGPPGLGPTGAGRPRGCDRHRHEGRGGCATLDLLPRRLAERPQSSRLRR